jgi:tetratricopeptide (TPR) repeat protein
VVDGEIRASGEDAVIITRLVDAVLSKQVGSDRRAVARASLAQDQEQLTLRLLYAIRETFDNAERRRSAAPLPANATAPELVGRAQMLTATTSGEDLASLREARKLYDEAIARDPSLVAAWAGRTDVEWNEFTVDYKADRSKLFSEMDRDSARAVELDPQDPAAWAARNEALQFTSRFDAAFAANDRARALDPAHYFFLRGFLLIFAGRAEEALTLVETRNAKLAQTDSSLEMVNCDANVHIGNYQQAIVRCEQAVAGNNSYWDFMNLTAAYAQAGEMTKAAAARDELLRRIPEFTITGVKAKQWSTNPIWVHQNEEHLIAELRKAGVPE